MPNWKRSGSPFLSICKSSGSNHAFPVIFVGPVNAFPTPPLALTAFTMSFETNMTSNDSIAAILLTAFALKG
jgi:hypothetical protein